MRLNGFSHLLAAAVLAGAAVPLPITTSQYDNARSGATVNESVLSPQNVNVHQFGKFWSLPGDGDVYVQPLYVPNGNVPGKGVHNLLFIATEHDSIYAFDVEKNSPTPLWHVNLVPAGSLTSPVSEYDVQGPFISPEIGITSTPIIDREAGTLYVLARAKIIKSRTAARYMQNVCPRPLTRPHCDGGK
jgi:hypothetical protein